MADGWRITENGDSGITEASVFRTTEKFYLGESALTGTATLTATATAKRYGAATLSASASMTASGVAKRYGASLVAGGVTLTATGVTKQIASATLNVSGAIVSAGVDYYKGYATLTATATLTGTGKVIKYGQVTSALVTDTRTTEAGDTRVLENATDGRIVNESYNNLIQGTMLASPTHIPFSSTTYVKVGGLWKEATTYVKHNGEWKIPLTSYRYPVTGWKRVE